MFLNGDKKKGKHIFVLCSIVFGYLTRDQAAGPQYSIVNDLLLNYY